MMPWRPHGRAEVNANRPRAWATCDRCGMLYNHYRLNWQFQWAGSQLFNERILVCPRCMDKPQEQLRTIILPPDPIPIANPRPEPYSLDEQQSTRVAMDGSIRILAGSVPIRVRVTVGDT